MKYLTHVRVLGKTYRLRRGRDVDRHLKKVCCAGVLLLGLLLLPAGSKLAQYIDGWDHKGAFEVARVSERGCREIQNWEGLRLIAYQDPRGIWTIGYGHTGPDVYQGKTITRGEAEALFRADLERFEKGVENSLNLPATQQQFDAMVCLAYNIGLGAFKRSTVLRKFNAGDYRGAADAFLMWRLAEVNGGYLELPGLVRRRQAERRLFLEGTPTVSATGVEDS